MRTRTVVLAVAAVVAVLAGVALVRVALRSPAGGQAAGLAPADALVYVSAAASGGQVAALEDLLGRFPGIDVSDGLVEAAGRLLEEPLGEEGLSFEADIAPWLGGEFAGFAAAPADASAEPDGAILIATTDADASRAAADKALAAEGTSTEQRTHREVAYTSSTDGTSAYTVLDGFLVAGNEGGVQAAIDASSDGGLDTSERFESAQDGLPADRLALYYLDLPGLFEAMEAAGELTPSDLQGMSMLGLPEDAVAAGAVSVQADRITVEQASTLPEDSEFEAALSGIGTSRLAENVPADAWLAFEVTELGATLEGVLDTLDEGPFPGGAGFIEDAFRDEFGLDLREDVLGWMGNTRLFVTGTAPLAAGVALIVDSTDPEATARLVDVAVALAEQQGATPRPVERDGLRGASVQEFGMPAPVFLLGGERLILGYGEEATDEAIAPTETLQDSAAYQDAASSLDGYDTAVYIDVAAAVSFAENAMALGGVPTGFYEAEVRPWLEPFAYLAAGARRDGDTVLQRLVIGLQDEA